MKRAERHHLKQDEFVHWLDELIQWGRDNKRNLTNGFFIVVGGAAAVLHGAPVTTQDLDIVPRVDGENPDRLMDLLISLDARIRDVAGRDLRPDGFLTSGLRVNEGAGGFLKGDISEKNSTELDR